MPTLLTAVITAAQGEFIGMVDPGEPDADPVGAASVLAFTELRAVEATLPEHSSSALERLGPVRPAVLVKVTRGRARTTSEVARAMEIVLPVPATSSQSFGRHSVPPMSRTAAVPWSDHFSTGLQPWVVGRRWV